MIKWTNGKKDVTECGSITIKVGKTKYKCVRDPDNDIWIIMNKFDYNDIKTTSGMMELIKFIDDRSAAYEVHVTELDKPIGKRNPNVDKFINALRDLREVSEVEDNNIGVYKTIAEYMLNGISDAINVAYLIRDTKFEEVN